MVKKSLLWLYSAVTYVLWTGIIVVAICVLGLRYYVLPHAKDYRAALNERSGVVLKVHTSNYRIQVGAFDSESAAKKHITKITQNYGAVVASASGQVFPAS